MRTTLLAGLLKSIRENRSHALPIRIFETSDVAFKDAKRERQARNERHAGAVWCNKTAGFEVVHGLLDRAMKMLDIPRISSNDNRAETGYYIKESNGMYLEVSVCGCLQVILDPMFFPGRAATIYYRAVPERRGKFLAFKQAMQDTAHVENDTPIGILGILHPTVLEKFEIGFPCSAVEFTLEPFKKQMHKVWTNNE